MVSKVLDYKHTISGRRDPKRLDRANAWKEPRKAVQADQDIPPEWHYWSWDAEVPDRRHYIFKWDRFEEKWMLPGNISFPAGYTEDLGITFPTASLNGASIDVAVQGPPKNWEPKDVHKRFS